MLREVEVEVGRGKTVAEAVKKIGVTEQTRAALGRDRMTTGANVRIQGVGSVSEHAATDAACSG